MARRLTRTLSIVSSLGLLLALGSQLLPEPTEKRERPPPQSKEAVSGPSGNSTRVVLAAVRLPPPPAPKLPPRQPKKIVVSPLKPKAVEKAEPAIRKPRPILKPPPPPPLRAPTSKPAAVAQTVAPDAEAAAEGRTLLRMLEHGSGPAIEIAWPASASVRAQLYRRFSACFGLRVAVLVGEDRLYIAEGTPGVPWRLNMDAYSGFMRQHDGDASSEESRELRRIRDVHRLTARGAPVRIFPRHVDAVLLGGLQ